MTPRPTTNAKGGLRIVGLGAAACAACCAGPLLAFLGGLSVAGLAGAALFGAIGLLVAIPAIVAFVIVRRRRRTCAPTTEPVVIEPPTLRAGR
jgi:mercuric ion transport protein